jgi:hypothetical protein
MSAQYVFEGKYREFRGYVFCNGNPVTITDRGTLEAIEKDETFKRIEAEEKQAPAEPAPVLNTEYRICSKCGKGFTRGFTMHERFCKEV